MSAKEIWKQIKFNTNYEISNLGNVRNVKTKRVLKPSVSNKGYYLVALSKNGKSHTYTIHKLVAEHFLVINHKDHNKLNNSIDNLEYVTQQENIQLAFKNGRCDKVKQKAKQNILKASNSEKIKVNQYDINGNFIKQWNYIREVQKALNINNANISECCRGKRKTAGGYIWRYVDEERTF